jgi:HTH-type transcriptional regulator/antitoxin HigA
MIRRNGKMTLTFNPQKYQELLLNYQPKIIRTEAENEKALAIVEELMHRSDRSPEEDELYELLITLIEKFEQEYYQPSSTTNPQSMLLFLLEQRGLNTQDLIKLFGSDEIVEDLMNGVQSAYQQQSILLGKFFNIDPSIFC